MLEYVARLRRHTQDRRALHIKLSSLERHMHEPFYRRAVAGAMREFVTKRGAKLFALPNADCLVVTHEASLDDLAPAIADIRRKLRDSKILARLDPMVGVTDSFIEWFDLEEDYDDFAAYTQQLAERLRSNIVVAKKTKKPVGKTKASKKTVPAAEEEPRVLDAFILASAMRKLPAADVSSAMRQQTVYAIVGGADAAPVLIHKYIDLSVLLSKLTGVYVEQYDRWLEGFLADEVAHKLLRLNPDLKNTSSIASSVRLTCAAILSDAFDAFDSALKPGAKSAVVIEISLLDVLAHPRDYEAAYRKVESRGYKLTLADVEPESLLWLDYEKLHATFIKLHRPSSVMPDWLSHDLEQDLISRIGQIGRARVILDGCETALDVELGQQLGITLFQGRHLD